MAGTDETLEPVSENAEGGKRTLTPEDKKVMRQLFWRSNLLMASDNKVVAGGHGVLYTLAPFLEEFYKDDPEERKAAFEGHSTFYNPNPYTGGLIWPLIYHLEKERSQDRSKVSAEAIENMKIALMGPTAAIGDTLFQGSLGVIIAALCMGLAQEGNFLAPILYLALFFILFAGLKWVFVRFSYIQGESFVTKLMETDMFSRMEHVISIVGLFMMGCLAATTISFSLNWTISLGGVDTNIQETLFDALLPGMLPLGILFACFALLGKKVPPTRLIYGIMLICIVLSYLGIV